MAPITYKGYRFTGYFHIRISEEYVEAWKALIDEAEDQDRSITYLAREKIFPGKKSRLVNHKKKVRSSLSSDSPHVVQNVQSPNPVDHATTHS